MNDPRKALAEPRGRSLTTALLALAGTGAAVFALFADALLAVEPFSHHMIAHIAFMNAAAPAAALIFHLHVRRAPFRLRALALFAALQLILFFAWHSPPMIAQAMASQIASLQMQISLFAAAFLFWLAVFHQRPSATWRSIAALLITGKLFCLMAVVLVFSPRVLYAAHADAISLADQQLAGLVMVVVCPLAYVASAVFLTVRWLNELARARQEPAMGAAA